jgi:hypothetical protein
MPSIIGDGPRISNNVVRPATVCRAYASRRNLRQLQPLPRVRANEHASNHRRVRVRGRDLNLRARPQPGVTPSTRRMRSKDQRQVTRLRMRGTLNAHIGRRESRRQPIEARRTKVSSSHVRSRPTLVSGRGVRTHAFDDEDFVEFQQAQNCRNIAVNVCSRSLVPGSHSRQVCSFAIRTPSMSNPDTRCARSPRFQVNTRTIRKAPRLPTERFT